MDGVLQLLDYVIVGLFFVVTFVIGVADRGRLTIEDYWVNGRRTNKFVIVATMLSTFIGAGTIIGGAGIAYAGGGLAILFAAASYFVYLLIFSRFFVPRIKAFGDAHGAYTIPDFLEARYSPKVRLAGAIVNLVTWALFLAVEILAIGTFISLLTGTHPVIGTVLGSLVVIIYTAVGGLRADIRTDVFQFFVMLVILVVFLPIVIVRAGGIWALKDLPSSFLLGSAFAPPYVYILMFFFLGTGALTSADLWQRVYASDSGKNARWAMNVSGVLITIFFVMAILFGLYGKILLPVANANNIFPALMDLTLPHGLFGLVLAGFFAAILSTADTVLLLTSMTIVHDLYQKTLKKSLSPEKVLKVSRMVTLSLGLVGLAVALVVGSIVHLAIEAVTFYIVLFPAIVFGFYSKKKSQEAAFWSIVIGMAATIVFLFIDPVQAFIPGLLVSLTTFIVVRFFEVT